MDSKLKDKIAGALVGYAIGDALGLGAEFMTAEEAHNTYPEGLRDYSDIIMDAHRSQWGQGNWSNDTMFVIQLAEDIMRVGHVDPLVFAHGMADWYGRGHYDIPAQLRVVLSHPKFREDPYLAARETFKKMGTYCDTSSVLGIAVICGMAEHDLSTIATELCSTLQCGLISQGCSQAVAETAQALLWQNRVLNADEVDNIVARYSTEIIPFVDDAATIEGIREAEVDDEDTLWMVRKALAAALWGLWHFDTFEEGLEAVIMLGGDADTNASLAGAFLGLKYGLSAIPARWIDGLKKREKILNVANRFADFLTARAQ